MLYLTVTLLKVFPAQQWFHSAFAKMPGAGNERITVTPESTTVSVKSAVADRWQRSLRATTTNIDRRRSSTLAARHYSAYRPTDRSIALLSLPPPTHAAVMQ